MGLAGARIPAWTCEPQCSSSGSIPSEPCHPARPRREAPSVGVMGGAQSCWQMRAVVSESRQVSPQECLCVGGDSVLRPDTGHGAVRRRKAQVSK